MRKLLLGLSLLNVNSTVCAAAANLNLSTVPLYVANSVAPNIYLLLDDSGSMDWEVLSSNYWHECAYDPNGNGSFSSSACGGLVSDGTFYGYFSGGLNQINYIYNNSDNVYGTGCNKATYANSVQACTGANTYEWRWYSADLNGVYYNPSTLYTPWPGPCLTAGTACANASFSAARSNPYQGQAGYAVTQNLAGMIYDVWIDNRGFTGSQPARGNNFNGTNTPNGIVDLWDDHIRITVNATAVTVQSFRYAPSKTGMNLTTTTQATLNNASTCYNALGPASLVQQIYAGTLAYTSTNAPGCQTIAQAQQNIANWYQYDRRHMLAARNAFSSVVSSNPNFKYAFSTINDNNGSIAFVPFPASSVTNYTAQNNTIVTTLFGLTQQSLGTPTPGGLAQAGTYLSGNLSGRTNPIYTACQQNYSVIVTDGFWNANSNIPNTIQDCDGDGYKQTLADVGCYYYNTDLSTLPNQVPSSTLDPANWQHMVDFGVGFGITGNLLAGSNGWPTPPLTYNSNWGNPLTNTAAAVDDLWHMAWDSHGFYLDASSPSAIVSGLQQEMANISARLGSAASVAQNSSTLQTTTQIYQSAYSTNNWSGSFLAYPVTSSGALSVNPNWDAGCVLSGGPCTLPNGTNAGISNTQRVIITRDWGNNGYQSVAFEMPSNYQTQAVSGVYPTRFTALMQYAPYAITTSNATQITANQTYGQALFNYLRGDRTQEQQNGGPYAMRNRSSRLGDIVDSTPSYVGAPSGIFTGSLASSYSTFASTYASRTPMIYIGANDGMLHGFRASDGAELMAYIPGDHNLYSKLAALSQPSYAHQFYVDGDVVTADAQYNNNWKTVLVGSLRDGGQSIYALDITNPALFNESTANNLLLWEFSDQNDPDLGFTYSTPYVARVNNGGNPAWAVIFGNGYNNTTADGYASTSGVASLYIALLNGPVSGTWTLGTNYYKISVAGGSTSAPNGLATPTPVDVNGDGVVDYVYAGDLNGVMWRFDLTASNPASWTVSKLFQAQSVTAGDQPITTAPVVTFHPNGAAAGQLVYFGTGQFLQITDNSQTGQVNQSIYAIWDRNTGTTVTKSQLLQQQILGEVSNGYSVNGTATTYTQRYSTNNAINWNSGTGQNLGWYMALIESGASSNLGERVVTQAIVRNNIAIFTTLVPSSSACSFNGYSWIMELQASNGGYLPLSPIDFNGTDQFSGGNLITVTVGGNTQTVAAAGFKTAVGATAQPTIIMSPNKQSEVKVANGTQGLQSFIENPGTQSLGRQSWRQLK